MKQLSECHRWFELWYYCCFSQNLQKNLEWWIRVSGTVLMFRDNMAVELKFIFNKLCDNYLELMKYFLAESRMCRKKKNQLFKLFLGVYIFVPTSVIQRCGFATAVLVNLSTRVGTEQWAVCTHWPSHHFWMPLQYTYVTITSKVAKNFLSNLLHCALSCTVYCNRPCLFVCLWVPYYSQRAVFASPLSAFGVRSSGRQTNWATDNWATI